MSADGLLDWEAAYREEGGFDGPPPWNIGEPQPELAALIEAGAVRSDVLDAGCGVAALSLALAEGGYTVVGLDLSPTAIAAAKRVATERGLTTASFAQADITSFDTYPPGCAGRFATVCDSTLFHSLPVAARTDYLNAIHHAAAPGARFYALVFAVGAFPLDAEGKPNEVTEQELREAVARVWTVDEIRPAFIHTASGVAAQIGDDAVAARIADFGTDDKGRLKMPAFLLTAHK